MKNNIRGYLYQIVEMFPIESGLGVRELTTHDRLEDAEKVLEVLDSVNYNFTCYGMMMRPVWEDEHLRREEKQATCDHSGSSSSLSVDGVFTFSCPKCGKHDEYRKVSDSWDANGSPL